MTDTVHIVLAGNPNVGKSTVFNALTGLHQHTGNWSGKTVESAEGSFRYGDQRFRITDLPGTVSLNSQTGEEAAASSYLASTAVDLALVICDASALRRHLPLAMQIIAAVPRTIVCLNLIDEAEQRGIQINEAVLSEQLQVPVIRICARKRSDIRRLKEQIRQTLLAPCPSRPSCPADPEALYARVHTITELTVREGTRSGKREQRLDRILTGKKTAFPIMLLLFFSLFWITAVGANIPSTWLSSLLSSWEEPLFSLLCQLKLPRFFVEMLIYGVYRVTVWVISVMLPPMAIFFPLFTLLEDAGYLPRIAYNLDRCFQKCNTCGKQALTMCMGLGCNAAGVTGCRIIDSARERMIAILTNSFIPCNGRIPLLITMSTLFFGYRFSIGSAGSALILSFALFFAVLMTLTVSAILSRTLLKGLPSSFILELPPYRRPVLHTILLRSLLDRTLFVLGRAAAVAAPAGLLIWLLANSSVNGLSLYTRLTTALDPAGRLLGMDGVILAAFLLGLPANETVIPLIVMGYLTTGSLAELPSLTMLSEILLQNGWTPLTAVCVMLFSLLHWPCSTTLWTVYRETGQLRWTLAAFILPTLCGGILCYVCNRIGSVLLL